MTVSRSMSWFRVAALLLASAALPVSVRSAEKAGACRGTLTGAVKGEFRCLVSVVLTDEGIPVFTVTPTQEIAGVASYVPGSFQLVGPIRAGTYTLTTLGLGRASVAAEGGTLYTAGKTTTERGEVSLTFRSVEATRSAERAYAVRGSYRARLLPAASAKQDDVVVEVTF